MRATIALSFELKCREENASKLGFSPLRIAFQFLNWASTSNKSLSDQYRTGMKSAGSKMSTTGSVTSNER